MQTRPIYTSLIMALSLKGMPRKELYKVLGVFRMPNNEFERWFESYEGRSIPEVSDEKLKEIGENIIAGLKGQDSIPNPIKYMVQLCMDVGLTKKQALDTAVSACEFLYMLNRRRNTNTYNA